MTSILAGAIIGVVIGSLILALVIETSKLQAQREIEQSRRKAMQEWDAMRMDGRQAQMRARRK